MLGEMGEVEDRWLPRMPSLNTEVPNSPRHRYLGPSPFMLVQPRASGTSLCSCLSPPALPYPEP